jgi:ubiquinone/menaquinone biosynthesis C-methylase UbiE
MNEPTKAQLKKFYDDEGGYDEVEEKINAVLSKSLNPRGPEALYDAVAALELPVGAIAIDVGCADGKHTFELAKRFGFKITGIDPVTSYVVRANKRKEEAADKQVADLVEFREGSATEIGVPEHTVDMIWCRDVIVHVADLKKLFDEFYRVLKPGGFAVTYQTFGTDLLSPAEAEWLWKTMLVVPSSAKIENVETAQEEAGFKLIDSIDLSSEWAEYDEEKTGKVSLNLLQAARIRRSKEAIIKQYGEDNYKIKLGDALWQVYKMIGKTTGHIFILQKPE